MTVEAVGKNPALRMGFDLMRPWGVISSVGVSNSEVRVAMQYIQQRHVLMLLRFLGTHFHSRSSDRPLTQGQDGRRSVR